MLVDDIARAAADSSVRDRPALIHPGGVVTYGELWRRIDAARAWFEAQLAPGSRVAFVLENSPELVVASYGAIAARMIAVPMDAGVHARNLEYVLSDAEPAAVVAPLRSLEGIAAAATSAKVQPRLIASDGVPPAAFGPGTVSLEELLSTSPAPSVLPSAPDAPALLSYTTGTTGPRKGALLSRRALWAATCNINAFMQLAPFTVELLAAPLSHSFGFGRLRCVLAARGTVVLPSRLNRPGELIDAIGREGASSIGLVPLTCRMWIDHFRARLEPLGAQLAFLELGSDFLDRRYKEALLELFPRARICMHYGLTEASRSTFLELRSERAHLDTIGRPTPNVEVGVRDGELCIRGDTVMLGYWRKPELTAEVLRDGWLHTGDLGGLDADGYLRLTGRRSDVFKIAGFSVAPREVEAVLAAHPLVAEAAVTLAASARSTAVELTALVVPKPGIAIDAAELRRVCRAELEAYKVPTHFVEVAALPRTPSGKLQRAELGALAHAGLAARTASSLP